MRWIELSIDTTHEAVDWVNTLLATIDYKGDVDIRPYQPDESQSPADEAGQPFWTFTIYLYIPSDGRSHEVLEKIAQRLASLHRIGQASTLQTAVLEAKPTRSAAPSASIQRIGQRFVVLAPDVDYQPQITDIMLELKNSLAFGSGLHPTTMAILRLLERHIRPTMHGLDLGCGSGILSVAIAKLGATVLALDNDAIAVQSTQDAVQRNGVNHQVTVMQGSLGRGSNLGHWMGGDAGYCTPTVEPAASFDFIVANILARMHISLTHDFRHALRQTATFPGLLLIAGFTADDADEVAGALAEAGFEAIDCERLNEWVALAYRLPTKDQ